MNKYAVKLRYGTFYINADYYSLIDGKYQFWVGRKVVVSYPESDVLDISIENGVRT